VGELHLAGAIVDDALELLIDNHGARWRAIDQAKAALDQ
jgi:hypothetical protein